MSCSFLFSILLMLESVTPWKLVSPDSTEGGLFGSSVAIYSNTLVVGSMGDDNANKRHSGSAYIYSRKRSTDPWVLTQKLYPYRAQSYDQFGCSVLKSDEFIFVGSLNGKVMNVNTGKVNIWTKDLTVPNRKLWSHQSELTSPDLQSYDEFGKELSYAEHVIAVSATGDDSKGRDSGAVYIYRFDGAWSQQSKIVADDGRSEQSFGSSLSLSVSLSVPLSLLVGSSQGISRAQNSSATAGHSEDAPTVYYYEGGGGAWSLQATLSPPGIGGRDQFGWSVSLQGDVAVVGARYSDGEAGSAHVFTRLGGGGRGGTWSYAVKLSPSDSARSRFFGDSLQLQGGVLLVGAYGWTDKVRRGGAYIFVRDVGTGRQAARWSQQAQLLPTDTWPKSYYGRSLALSEDGESLAVGAPGAAEYAVEVGAVCTYRFIDGQVVKDPHGEGEGGGATISAEGSDALDTYVAVAVVMAICVMLLAYCMCCASSSGRRLSPESGSFSCLTDDSTSSLQHKRIAGVRGEYELASFGINEANDSEGRVDDDKAAGKSSNIESVSVDDFAD